MTLFALPGRTSRPRTSSACSRLGSVKPLSRPRAPALSVSRRVSPSQQRRGGPSMVIMVITPPREPQDHSQLACPFSVCYREAIEQPQFEACGGCRPPADLTTWASLPRTAPARSTSWWLLCDALRDGVEPDQRRPVAGATD